MATPEEIAAAAAAGVAAATPPRPSWEQKTTTVTPAPGEAANATRIAVSEGGVANAMDAEGGIDVNEARIEAQRAEAKRQHAEAEKVRLAQEEADFQAQVSTRNAEEKTAIDKAARSKVAGGQARATYWNGNPVGEFVAAIVRSVAAGQMARQGKDGVSPAERIINDKIAAHEQALVAQAEADAELRDLKIKDRPRWDAAMAHIRKVAADESAHDLAITMAVSDAAIAKLGPDKKQAAMDLKKAVEEKQNAANEQKRLEGLRGRFEFERREKTAAAGAGAGGKATEGTRKSAGQAGLILESLKDALSAPPVSKEGLAKINTNRRLTQAGDKAPLADAIIGMTPAEGDTEGLSDADKASVASASVLTDTITYLTSGAAVTPEEGKRKLDQLRVLPTDGPDARKAKLTNAVRFAEAAAVQAGPNWTPQHQETLDALKGKIAEIGKPPKSPAAPGPGKGPLVGPSDLSGASDEDLQEMLRFFGKTAKQPASQDALGQVGREIDRRRKAGAGGR